MFKPSHYSLGAAAPAPAAPGKPAPAAAPNTPAPNTMSGSQAGAVIVAALAIPAIITLGVIPTALGVVKPEWSYGKRLLLGLPVGWGVNYLMMKLR